MDGLMGMFSVFGAMQPPIMPQGPFKGKFHAYPPAFWNSENRDKLETGDKIVVPASVLEQLSRLKVSFPIMFRITHLSDILPKRSHCSVLEFTADEGNVYMPKWMIENLGLDPDGNSMVELQTVTLNKGTLVEFQPRETKFAMLDNPKVVLETALRSYSALTVGDSIPVQFANRVYKLEVTAVEPKGQNAISIIETDLKVDFKEPLDYKEWEKTQKEAKEKTQKELQAPETKEEEEDKEWVSDTTKENEKTKYFEELEQLGAKGNLVKQKSLRRNVSSNSLNGSTSKPNTTSYSVPSKTRGAPLGSSKSAPLSTPQKKFIHDS